MTLAEENKRVNTRKLAEQLLIARARALPKWEFDGSVLDSCIRLAQNLVEQLPYPAEIPLDERNSA